MSDLKELVDGELVRARYNPIGPFEPKFRHDILNFVCKGKHYSPGSIKMIRDGHADWWLSGMAKIIVESLLEVGNGILSQQAIDRASELHELLKDVVLATPR